MSAAQKPRQSIAPSALVSPTATVGTGTVVWDLSQIRDGASIGADTVIGRNVYIDRDVVVGQRCKIQNNSLIYWPAILGDGVFIGPGVTLTNDRNPRAVNPDDSPKTPDDWIPEGVEVADGASIGAGAILLPGVKVGRWALVGAGAVVSHDVPAHALVAGNPATQVGWVGRSGFRLVHQNRLLIDPVDGSRYRLDGEVLMDES